MTAKLRGSCVAPAVLAVLLLPVAPAADQKRPKCPPVLPPIYTQWAKTYDAAAKPRTRQMTIVVIGASLFNQRMEVEHARGWRVVPGTLDIEVADCGISSMDSGSVIAVTLEKDAGG